MDKILPNSFVNALAGFTLLVGVVLLLLSLIPKIRARTTRIFAIFFVVGLALFSNHWTTYFASILIIATAVTELNFLQNLVAIISQNRYYFDYQRELITKDEALLKRGKDEQEILEHISPSVIINESKLQVSRQQGDLKDDEPKTPISRRQLMQIGFQIEELALKYMEDQLRRPIDKLVRYVKKGKSVEFAGVLQEESSQPDKIFEVKWVPNEQFFSRSIHHTLTRMQQQLDSYKEITRRENELHLVVVVPQLDIVLERRLSELLEKYETIKPKVKIHRLTYEDIGFNPELIEV
jgi:hypothetical protein